MVQELSGNDKNRKLQRTKDKGRTARKTKGTGHRGIVPLPSVLGLLPLLFPPIFTGSPLRGARAGQEDCKVQRTKDKGREKTEEAEDETGHIALSSSSFSLVSRDFAILLEPPSLDAIHREVMNSNVCASRPGRRLRRTPGVESRFLGHSSLRACLGMRGRLVGGTQRMTRSNRRVVDPSRNPSRPRIGAPSRSSASIVKVVPFWQADCLTGSAIMTFAAGSRRASDLH